MNLKKTLLTLLCAMPFMALAAIPDSVWVRPVGRTNGMGLWIEWSSNGQDWTSVTNSRLMGSDYGGWGIEKKLFNPSFCQAASGLTAIAFQLNDHSEQFGVSSTTDFISFRPQDFPFMKGVGECLYPVIAFSNNKYTVTFHNKAGQYFRTFSADLKSFSQPEKVDSQAQNNPIKVPYQLIMRADDHYTAAQLRQQRQNEQASDNATRFAGLSSVEATVTIDATNAKNISDKLMGIFFEDINYAADGGLNADLVQNGDFEYRPHDMLTDSAWNQLTAWQLTGEAEIVLNETGISPNNSQCVGLRIAQPTGATLSNTGWDGMVVEKGKKYNLGISLRGGKVRISIKDNDKTLATTTLNGGKAWTDRTAVLVPNSTSTQAKLCIEPLEAGLTCFDLVSLFPQDTYKGHGIRKDLAETLAALAPRFMRFPGGCVAHGDGIENIYNWKETIGPYRDRKPQRNLWNYHQSRRIGYYEFFQLCEDMQMEPVPVVAAGVPCQNSRDGGAGQQGGIPMEEMDNYIQDILDLIEWANGDIKTTWGKKRAEQGHPKPFGLKTIAIGNEDLVSSVFVERYLMICKAIKAKYPEIEVCGTAGPFFNGPDYEEGWRLANQHSDIINLIDEHYYVSPGWYIYNHNFYDQYDRNAPKVYLGEWAAHNRERKSTIETALSEALHYCALERNGDVVVMSSYAPLLANEKHTQWNPNMIYFNNTEVKPTVCYQAQKMCGNSAGNQYISSTISTRERRQGVRERLGISTVRNTSTGKTYIKLVNILPVEVTANLKINGLTEGNRTCKIVTLTGEYDSTTAVPTESTTTIAPNCTLSLPPYSFSVVEL